MKVKKKAPPVDRPFPIVGIGASAGGLEAVSRLLSALPADTGMAFVVVQHLDPSRESLLPSLLQKAAKMPVAQAKNGAVIAPNQVYVIPPNTQMVVVGGRLRLTPRPAALPVSSVNCFLRSLAEERGNKGIAVILSGTASDGTLGVKAIKAEGGLVFAQDEESAGFFGMPQSAAATGLVDFILPPEKIAEELAQIASHPLLGPQPPAVAEDADSLRQIFLILRRTTGLDFANYKPSTIKRRMLRRLMLHKLHGLDKYVQLLEREPDEVRALHDDLLIHVTHFFREPKSLAILRAKAFPRLLKALPSHAPIRVWVPGCSTGEEAYTLAISLFDFLSERDAMNPVQIFATDVSEASLDRARAGVYTEELRSHVPARLLRRFFTKTDRGYQIVKRVRDVCVFAKQDLTKDPPFANIDIISCRNVLIYLGAEIQRQILPIFHYALRPAGSLFLGDAEAVGEFEHLFEPADKRCRLFYKVPSPHAAGFRPGFRPAARAPEHAAAGKAKHAPPAAWPEGDALKVAENILLARFAPAGVIISNELNILHFRGDVNRFLEPAPGKASLALLKMLPAHSTAAVGALINKARKAEAPVKETAVELGYERGRTKTADLEVIPFRLPISRERYFIVLFKDESAALREHAARPGAKPERAEGAGIKRLKSQLESTRGYLQTIVEEHEAVTEELKAANEEIVSSNEELQSTNEELEIAKEELQAANEELNTVNEELQTRNGDLGLVNNDLLNLIASVHLPLIMVSSDLRVRRYSAAADQVMELRSSDIGRPIGEIASKIALPNFEEIIHDVIETVTAKELDVRDKEGHSYAVRIQPYKTTENKIEGAVLVFIDNDPIQRSRKGIEDASAFEAVLELSGEALTVLDGQMRVKATSRTMYQAFGLTQSSLGRSLFEIEDGRWDVPALRAQLEKLAVDGQPFTKSLVQVGSRTYSFSARRIKSAANALPLILLSINDWP